MSLLDEIVNADYGPRVCGICGMEINFGESQEEMKEVLEIHRHDDAYKEED